MTALAPEPAVAGAAAPPALELRGIHAAYEQVEVLHGVDLAVPAGSVVAVLGPNGAGKTTMLRVASGLHAPTKGELHLAGRNVTGTAPVELARLGLCSVPEGRGVFPNLTVSENLWMATYRGISRGQIEERVFPVFPRLKERRNQAAGTMSGGEQQMLAMARAIATDPAVLLIDELSMGLAPLVVDQLFEIVKDIAEQGVTVLLVEQFARTALKVADLAAVMTHGRVTEVGRPDEIASHLHSAYLGGGDAPAPGHAPREETAAQATLLLPVTPPAPAAAPPAGPPAPVPAPPAAASAPAGAADATQVLPAISTVKQGDSRGEGMSINPAAGAADGNPTPAAAPGAPTVATGAPLPPPPATAPPTLVAPQPPAQAAGRHERLAADVSGLRVKAPSTQLDTKLMWVGLGLMIVGVLTGIIAYGLSHSTRYPLEQRDAMTAAIAAIPVSILGLGLFLRYSIGNFLRFWIARLVVAQQQRGGGEG